MTDLRGKIKRTIDQTFGPFSDGVVERIAWSISRVPEIAESQARIAALEAALSATDKALRVYGAKPDFYRAASHQAQEALKPKP
jgi:hypothetical protein